MNTQLFHHSGAVCHPSLSVLTWSLSFPLCFSLDIILVQYMCNQSFPLLWTSWSLECRGVESTTVPTVFSGVTDVDMIYSSAVRQLQRSEPEPRPLQHRGMLGVRSPAHSWDTRSHDITAQQTLSMVESDLLLTPRTPALMTSQHNRLSLWWNQDHKNYSKPTTSR